MATQALKIDERELAALEAKYVLNSGEPQLEVSDREWLWLKQFVVPDVPDPPLHSYHWSQRHCVDMAWLNKVLLAVRQFPRMRNTYVSESTCSL